MKKTTLTKSFIAVLSAATMTALSTTAAFAEDKSSTPDTIETADLVTDSGTTDETVSCDVDISYQEATAPTAATDAVYKVVVEWDSLNFEYAGTVWNPDTHLYEASETDANGGWTDPERTVKVTNHSNWGITYTPSWESPDTTSAAKSAEKNGVAATLSTIEATNLGACPENGDYDTAPNGSFTVTVSGKPTTNNSFMLNTVNVKIEPTVSTN